MTNYERIQQMTLEEMAKEFAEVFFNNPIMEKLIIGYLEGEVEKR